MPGERSIIKRIAITGGFGFLGWHTACRLRAVHGIDPVRLGRQSMDDPSKLESTLADVDGVIHIAGINRADTDKAVETGNVLAAESLASALANSNRTIPVAYANSIQAARNTPYGRGKASAARILQAVTNGGVADVWLPNLFGEHGRPAYNSFVATFAHALANGQEPTVTGDNDVPLLHAQAAAAELIDAVLHCRTGEIHPAAESHSVSAVLERLQRIHRLYDAGDLPPLWETFDVDLFNTYRSYRFPDSYPMVQTVHSDQRGELFEALRSHGSSGQTFASSTRPGFTRGDHYHLRKIERFLVLKGEAEISLRRILHDEVITFRVSGELPAFVDMPTLWTHNLRNVGEEDLYTLFWSDQLLDPKNPDQYAERVTP